MAREYDFGEGGKVALTGRTAEHKEMFVALQCLGAMGARIAKYINDLKGEIRKKDAGIANLKVKAEAETVEAEQAEVHEREFPKAMRPAGAFAPKSKSVWVYSDRHTPGPWRMLRSGMIKVGSDWICAVTARNRIYNGPLIEAAPDMLAMLERMLSSPSPTEAHAIIAEATALVGTAKSPAWERHSQTL